MSHYRSSALEYFLRKSLLYSAHVVADPHRLQHGAAFDQESGNCKCARTSGQKNVCNLDVDASNIKFRLAHESPRLQF